MPQLILWHLSDGPPSLTTRIVGKILGLDFDLREVDYDNGEHKTPEYRKRNPMATIPVLQDGDIYLSDSHVINKYLIRKYGPQHLERMYPSDILAQAKVDQALFFDTGILFPLLLDIVVAILVNNVTEITAQLVEKTDKAYDTANMYLERSTFIAGNTITLADIHVGVTLLCLRDLTPIDASRFPKVPAYLDRLIKESSHFKDIAVTGSAMLAKHMQDIMDQNKTK